MVSSGCGGDDDDDGDDDVACAGDDALSSAAVDEVVGCGVLAPADPGVAVVHREAPGCSPTGDGVDVVWYGGVRQSTGNRPTDSVSGGIGAILRRSACSDTSYGGGSASTTLAGMR